MRRTRKRKSSYRLQSSPGHSEVDKHAQAKIISMTKRRDSLLMVEVSRVTPTTRFSFSCPHP